MESEVANFDLLRDEFETVHFMESHFHNKPASTAMLWKSDCFDSSKAPGEFNSTIQPLSNTITLKKRKKKDHITPENQHNFSV